MQSLFPLAVAAYISFYVFEGLIRYALHLSGADTLIFVRDALLLVPLLILFLQQLFRKALHPAFLLYLFVIGLHGIVMMCNIGSFMAVLYGAKMLMTLVAGALAASALLQPQRWMVRLVFLFWLVSLAGILLDKFYMEMPWMGMETTIGDVQVELGRDWQISGAEKRAGGFMRSSINAATVVPLLALMLIFHMRSLLLRAAIAAATVPAIIWTTQKGPILAYVLTLGVCLVAVRKPVPVLRFGILVMLVLMVALPVILPGYSMPRAEGVFSFSSFYQRVEDMWPDAWRWIRLHEAFPFGVGLGGISGAQRLYALHDMNAADNMFVLMYGYFGVMSLVYLAGIALVVLRLKNDYVPAKAQALATLLFLLTYGCVISLLEDQMASLFLGAALAWLAHSVRNQRKML